MLCDECGKNQASIHIVQITPEGKAARNLCQQCAAKFGAGLPSLEEMGDLEGDFTVNDFLRGVFGGSQSHRDEKKNRPLTGTMESLTPQRSLTAVRMKKNKAHLTVSRKSLLTLCAATAAA